MLYSDGPEDTADIVGLLLKKEASKGHRFPSPLEIGDRERRVLPLYQVCNLESLKMLEGVAVMEFLRCDFRETLDACRFVPFRSLNCIYHTYSLGRQVEEKVL